MSSADYVLAIDQGTTSTRAIVFDRAGQIVSTGQIEHRQILPRAGWVEHDPLEIWANVRTVVAMALTSGEIPARALAAVGITNQRETAVVWDRRTGEPACNAIVWQDTRTKSITERLGRHGGPDRFKDQVGLPLATYFTGPKIAWILENVDGARTRAEAGDLIAGTIDSWLLWNLTGGAAGGVHATDVTNASRTLLMNIETLDWNDEICDEMDIPPSMLPVIRSSSEIYGYGRPDDLLAGVPIAGLLGDQQAATFGQACFRPGTVKNTYGTGSFLLMNTGTSLVRSDHGLLSTICYQLGATKAVYALEGSIAMTGSLVQWMRDNLGLISKTPEIETYARKVEDNGGVYIVPAFSGLFAPYWRSDARGAIFGLSRYANRSHLCRAVLESVAYQTRDVVAAMNADVDVAISELKVDGGMVGNEVLMQLQADQLGVDVVRPGVTETTALGAAYIAGLAVGFWSGLDEITDKWVEGRRWTPAMSGAERDRLHRNWIKAVGRTLDWVDADTEPEGAT